MTRRLLIVVLLAALLSGCGLFGDDDADASSDDGDNAVETIRVSFEERWFDVDAVDFTGAVSEVRLDRLRRQVDDLAIESDDAADATVGFADDRFVGVEGVVGARPDVEGLAVLLTDAVDANISTVDVPFEAVAPSVGVADAADFAEILNRRTDGGLQLSVESELARLPRSSIAAASTIDNNDGEWTIEIRWAEIANEISNLFPDVGQLGTDAHFIVEEPEDPDGTAPADQPARVVIVPGAPRTVCCDSRSTFRIEQALTHNIEVARLFLRNADPERGNRWAENLQITELVGTFTTSYTPGQSRVTNIRRIAELTQGVVIEPGESLSLNEFVGRRTAENGFVPAGTIVNGHLVDSVGGGISQFATTIFNAAFFAGLEFDSYQSHSIYFSRYPYGREATISWPNPDLKIHNPSPYGVLIWPTSTAGSVTVDIYSTTWATGEQTGQTTRMIQEACTRVTTERTRTFVEDGHTETDTVFATYRPEGIACDGSPTDDPDADQLEKLENGENPDFENGVSPRGGGDGIPPEEQPPPPTEPPPETPTTTTTEPPPRTTTTTTEPAQTTTTTSTTTTTTTTAPAPTTTTVAPEG